MGEHQIGGPGPGEEEEVHAMNNYNPRPRNDPFSNTYNPGLRNHPNFSWSNNNNCLNPGNQWGNNYNQRQGNTGAQQNFESQPKKTSVEDLLLRLEQQIAHQSQQMSQQNQRNEVQFQNIQASLKKTDTQVGQLAEAQQRMENGKFPSFTKQAKAMTILRNGKTLTDNSPAKLSNKSAIVSGPSKENTIPQEEEIVVEKSKVSPLLHKSTNTYIPPVPFPGRLQKSKLEKSYKDIYDILSKVNVNLPLLEMIQKMPAYAKFFKSLHTYKTRFVENHQEFMTGSANSVLQKSLPPKLQDPGSFCINITIGGTTLERAMLDLGASINLMPFTIYEQLGLNDLKKTTMSLLLADGFVRYPRGYVEDVLVQVDNLIIPADFVVLDMDEGAKDRNCKPILLGRPFMATAKTFIDVQNGKLTMTVLDETVEFKVFESLKFPEAADDCHSAECSSISVVNSAVQD